MPRKFLPQSASVGGSGFLRELEDMRQLVHDRWQQHATLGSVYGAASNFLIIVGIAATAIAGITAAGDLLGQKWVGAIAMSAAVLTAVGAGLPWDKRARDHANVASLYLSLRSDIAARIAQLESTGTQPDADEWSAIFSAFTKQREHIDRLASDISMLRGGGSVDGGSTSDRTPPD